MGGTVVGRVMIGDENWHDDCADLIASHQPESVYIIAYADKTIEVLRHLRSKGYSGHHLRHLRVLLGRGDRAGAELVDGVLLPAAGLRDPVRAPDDPKVRRLVPDEYGHDPDIYAAHAYDAMRVALEIPGIVRAWEANEIRRALQFEIKEFPGVTGPIQFDDYGDVRHNPVMFIVKDGVVMNYQSYLEIEKQKIRDKIKKLLQNQEGG
jgi:branched-chain amino acid transport system substrate-binding protein